MAKTSGPQTNGAKGVATKPLLKFAKNYGPALEYYWSDVTGDVILAALDAVTRHGGAIMFGRTQDGGAYSILVLIQDQKAKQYPHSPEEAAELLTAIAAEFTED